MLNEGKGIRLSQLVAVAVLVGGLGWVGLKVYLNRGNLLPYVSWVSAVTVVLAAALVLAAGLPVRTFLRGQATRTLSPIRAARTLVLAQAAAITGAGVTGWYVAVLALVVPDLELASAQSLLWPAVAAAVGGAVLATVGLVVQRMCRIDPPDDPPGRPA